MPLSYVFCYCCKQAQVSANNISQQNSLALADQLDPEHSVINPTHSPQDRIGSGHVQVSFLKVLLQSSTMNSSNSSRFRFTLYLKVSCVSSYIIGRSVEVKTCRGMSLMSFL